MSCHISCQSFPRPPCFSHVQVQFEGCALVFLTFLKSLHVLFHFLKHSFPTTVWPTYAHSSGLWEKKEKTNPSQVRTSKSFVSRTWYSKRVSRFCLSLDRTSQAGRGRKLYNREREGFLCAPIGGCRQRKAVGRRARSWASYVIG